MVAVNTLSRAPAGTLENLSIGPVTGQTRDLGVYAEGLEWSPDGNFVLVGLEQGVLEAGRGARCSPKNWEIWRFRGDFTNPMRLTDSPNDDYIGGWSPDHTELTRLGLTPSWKFILSISALPPLVHQGPLYVVQYQRVVDVSAGVTAGEVDGNGDPAGIQVVVDSSGKALQVTGILRLAEQRASYRFALRPQLSTRR